MKFALVTFVGGAPGGGKQISRRTFSPPNTKVVFGVRVPAIVESALFKDTGTGAQKLSEDWLKVVAVTGFDPLHDIDEVLLASPADNEKAAALLVLRGRFDLARFSAGATRYHGVAMLGGGKDGKGVLALLDEATLLAGDTLAVRAAIDRHGKNAAPNATLAMRVQSLRERFDVWGTGERPEGFVAPTGKNEQLDFRGAFFDSVCASVKDSNSTRRCTRAHPRMPTKWPPRFS